MFFCFFKTCSWQDIHLGWAWTTSTRTNELGYTHTRNPSRFSTKGEENWNTFGETRMYPVQMNGTNLKRCLLRSFCLFIHSNWMSKCSATIETCPLPVVCNKRLYSLKDGSLCRFGFEYAGARDCTISAHLSWTGLYDWDGQQWITLQKHLSLYLPHRYIWYVR